ncbi:MAG: hypothetical protein ACQSGP_20710 [Frankia sp.]
MSNWLLEDTVDDRAVRRSVMAADAFTTRGGSTEAAGSQPDAVAIRLRDLVVHNNRKWFDLVKGADVRIDALIVQGNILTENPEAAYTPTTLRFPDVGDGDTLTPDPLLVYYGWPRHFLDLAVLVSRDRQDSDDLASLLTSTLDGPDVRQAIAGLAPLALAAPQAAAVVAGLQAARVLADVAYRTVKAACGSTIGFYRGSHLAYPERFGRGRNPADGLYHANHMSFWYDIVNAGDEPAA